MGGNHQGPGPFCTKCGQLIPEPSARATNASCSGGNHQGPGPFCTVCGQRMLANPPVTSTTKMSMVKKILMGFGGILGVMVLIGIVGAAIDDLEEEDREPNATASRQGYIADCTGLRESGVVDIGDIPECIEKDEFDENSFRRVKVNANVAGHQVGKLFKLYDWDSEGRPINSLITVDHQETYETMIRLGRGDWVNLSCLYYSVNYVEEYSQGGDVPYAVVHLTNCIDLE